MFKTALHIHQNYFEPKKKENPENRSIERELYW